MRILFGENSQLLADKMEFCSDYCEMTIFTDDRNMRIHFGFVLIIYEVEKVSSRRDRQKIYKKQLQNRKEC